MEANTISITLWGDGLIRGKWLEWYNYVGTLFEKIGYERTHIAMGSDSYTNKKIVTVSRKEKQILQILKNGGKPTRFSCYSLPKDYKTAAFGYNVMMVRESDYTTLIMNMSDFAKIDVDSIISQLMQYIVFECGEIYQMDRAEMPLIYAARANPIDSFKSYNSIKKF